MTTHFPVTPVASRAHARSYSSMDAYVASREKTAAAIAQFSSNKLHYRHASSSPVYSQPQLAKEEPIQHELSFSQLAGYYEQMVKLDPYRTQMARLRYLDENRSKSGDVETKARGYAVWSVNNHPQTLEEALGIIQKKQSGEDEILGIKRVFIRTFPTK